MNKKPKRGGSDTFREKGLIGVLIGFTPVEYALLKKAAVLARDGAMSAYIHRLVTEDSKRVIDQFREQGDKYGESSKRQGAARGSDGSVQSLV